jgi:amidohydrolase
VKPPVFEAAKVGRDFVVKTRRAIHEHPELSGKEVETVRLIKKTLEEWSIPYTEIENGGIVACLTGKKGEKRENGRVRTLVLRADVDALPIVENEQNLVRKRDCISQNRGVMHACGHDAHTAVLLSASRILFGMREKIDGRIFAVFERGEEGLGLLTNIIAWFAREGIRPDGAHAIHVRPDLPSGKIAVLEGPVFASPLFFDITLKGQGGHGSRPDRANNPLDCFVHFYGALKLMRERYVSPFEPLTTNIGIVNYGTLSNVIADELRFTGSARLYHEETCAKFLAELDNLLDHISAAFHCTYQKNKFGAPLHPVINDKGMAKTGQEAVCRYMGREYLVDAYEPMMCSDDFAFFGKVCPTLMVHLGIGNAEKGSGGELHSDTFDVDEDALPLGVAETAAFALQFFEDAACGGSEGAFLEGGVMGTGSGVPSGDRGRRGTARQEKAEQGGAG